LGNLPFSPDHVALSLVAHGMGVTKSARYAGRHPTTVWRWLRHARKRVGKSLAKAAAARSELSNRNLELLGATELIDAIMTGRGYRPASPGVAELD